MIPLTLAEIARAVGGEAGPTVALSAVIGSISTDSRELAPGSLFVALRGERFDGHAFLQEAARRDAAAAIVEVGCTSPLPPLIHVSDTTIALGDIARAVRRASAVRVAAVTGSVGKTTTKDLLALALSPSLRVLKNEANLNNQIGVPLTLLKLDPSHQAAVVELAMRGEGEIRYLSRIAEPNVAVITNIGTAHVGRLGGQDAIANAKAEILESLAKDGAAVLNRDDGYFDFLAERAPRVFSFGLESNADIYPLHISDRGLDGLSYTARSGGASAAVQLPIGGHHFLVDSLAALAAVVAMGEPLERAAGALSHFTPGVGRGSWSRLANGAILLDDSYNAGPDSVSAALRLLASTRGLSRRVAVLGDMLEMGDFAPAAHREVGEAAAGSGLARLICVGPESRGIQEAAIGNGMAADRVFWYPDSETAAAESGRWIEGIDGILVKGSNGMNMRVIVNSLREVTAGCNGACRQ